MTHEKFKPYKAGLIIKHCTSLVRNYSLNHNVNSSINLNLNQSVNVNLNLGSYVYFEYTYLRHVVSRMRQFSYEFPS
jgi:hypothetical protein